MNIFLLDKDPKICAQMHCDKHIIKMCTEYNQILSTAHRFLDGQLLGKKYTFLDKEKEEKLMKSTHINHPSCKWARENSMNYKFLYNLFCAVAKEYTHRYGKIHGSYSRGKDVLNALPKNIHLSSNLTDFPQAMPDKYKVAGDAVQAYKNYYNGDKAAFAKWTNREVPEWFQEENKAA